MMASMTDVGQSAPSPLMNVAEVATLLGVHSQTVREMARKRQIPSIKFGSRNSPYRFRPASIEAWLEEQEKGSVAHGQRPGR